MYKIKTSIAMTTESEEGRGKKGTTPRHSSPHAEGTKANTSPRIKHYFLHQESPLRIQSSSCRPHCTQ